MSQQKKKFIGDDQVSDDKILLDNNDYLVGRNAANNADVNMFRVNASNSLEMGATLNAGGFVISNVGAPVSANDVATKTYADSISAGIDPKESVHLATTSSSDFTGATYASTPSNGRWTSGPTSLDSVSVASGRRYLIKDATDAKRNGIYIYDGGGQYTRSSDMDGSPASEVSAGNFTFIEQGTVNSGKGYVVLGNGTLTLNTDNVSWSLFTSAGSNTVLDSVFRIQDNGDTSKQLAFEVSAITTATTRTITVGDENINVSTGASSSFLNRSLSNGSGILPIANGSTGSSTTFTSGSVVFSGGSGVYSQDNTNLFWDNSNKRLGIGNNAPSHELHVGVNTGAGSATPITLSLGGSYSSTAGANPKLRLYEVGAAYMGLGISGNQLDYVLTSTVFDHVFYSTSELMRIRGAGGVSMSAYGAGVAQFSAAGLISSTAPGTSGNVLTSNGTAWVSQAPASGAVSLSALTAAAASNSIDNLNFAQTWSWTTLSSGNAMSFATGNSITSGKIMQFTQSANGGGVNNTIMQMDLSGSASLVKGLTINNSSGSGGPGPGTRGITVAMSGAGQDGFGIELSSSSAVSSSRALKINVTGTTGTVYGIEAQSSKTEDGTYGIYSNMSAATGITYGTAGFTNSTNAAARGGNFSVYNASATGYGIQATNSGTGGAAILATATATGVRNVVALQNTVAAANNSAAAITFSNNRTTSGQTTVAQVAGMITDITAGAYKGALVFYTANNAAPAERMRLSETGALNLAAYTTAGVLVNDASGNVTDVAPGTSGNVLTSNGTAWVSQAPPFEMITATSASKTATATDRYPAFSGNSLALTAGTWELFGNVYFTNGGTSPTYSTCAVFWGSANGADTNVAPADIASAANLTVLSTAQNFMGAGVNTSNNCVPAPPYIVQVTANTTVYLVAYVTLTTAANSRIFTYANARRLK